MEVRDLYVSQLKKLMPLKVEETNLDDITDSRLGEWAIEICADVFNERSDLPCVKKQGSSNEGDN